VIISGFIGFGTCYIRRTEHIAWCCT